MSHAGTQNRPASKGRTENGTQDHREGSEDCQDRDRVSDGQDRDPGAEPW